MELTMAMLVDWDEVARKLDYPSEKAMWVDLYEARGFSLSQLAKRFNLSPVVIRTNLLRCGVKMRKRGGAHNVITPHELVLLEEQVLRDGVKAVAQRNNLSTTAIYKRLHKLRDMRAELGLPSPTNEEESNASEEEEEAAGAEDEVSDDSEDPEA
jgi:hypothetical protein